MIQAKQHKYSQISNKKKGAKGMKEITINIHELSKKKGGKVQKVQGAFLGK